MFEFWGDGSQEAMDLVDAIRVRSAENFNRTFIFTTYVPFFPASNYVPDTEPKKRKTFLIVEWSLVALLLAVLNPLGII